jgi:hypothetical protein
MCYYGNKQIGEKMMSIFELMNSTIECNDLLIFGEKLINFADAALLEKNRATIVKHFYEHLREWTISDYVFEINTEQYLIYE